MSPRPSQYSPISRLILWDLKLHGDINQTHAGGGNASRVLFERVKQHAYKSVYGNEFDWKQFRTTLSNLNSQGVLRTVVKNAKIFAIRLAADELPENPYQDAPTSSQSRAIEPVSPAEVIDNGSVEEWRNWPITRRLALVEAVSASLREDMEVFKTGVVDGL